LKNNLYRIWNRMSSGSYVPPPVKRVMIPKADGKQRPLGIPTVGDRVAQMVVKMELEPKVEPLFHPDSYGYRPKKSALDAVGVCRTRCWRHDWIVDLDIRGFFDNIDHSLMMHAVRKHTDCPWVLLYIERWLIRQMNLRDMVISMTEENHCYENSQAERLNGILKQEYGLGGTFRTKCEVRPAVREAISLYNDWRPHGALGNRIPMQVHQAPAA
jgi:hypothetical protein